MNNKAVVIITNQGPFPIEADRIEDILPEVYKIYLKGTLQGVFNKTSINGYFWDLHYNLNSICHHGGEDE